MVYVEDSGRGRGHTTSPGLKIIHLLSQREWYVYELAKTLNVSIQVLYLHLKRLEKAGFVEGGTSGWKPMT